jgi:hypothetical protein
VTPQDQILINAIFYIRVRNNIPWKKIMEIAMNHAPEETKKALKACRLNDQAICDLNEKLAP